LEQKTVNLVIVIAAVVVAAGAWSGPLLTAQTVHNFIADDLDDAVTTINTNTDSETGQIGAGFFGAGTDLDDAFGDCTLMDLMISIALDENVQQLCDLENIEDFIESDIHFSDFNDQFQVQEQFLELRSMQLIPNRDCEGLDLDDTKIFLYQDDVGATREFISGVGAGTFGAIKCIHQFSFEDTPLQVKAISLEDSLGADAQKCKTSISCY